MDRMLKTSEVGKQNTPIPNQAPTPAPSIHYQQGIGIPIEVYRFFNVKINGADKDTVQKLQTIYDWAKDGSKDIGDTFLKLRQLDHKVGQPSLDETRYDRFWNYVRMDNNRRMLEAKRNAVSKEEKERFNAQKNAILKEADKRIEALKGRKQKEIEKINSEVKEPLKQITKIQKSYER